MNAILRDAEAVAAVSPIDRFRALVMADDALQVRLIEHLDPARFADDAIPIAAAAGIVLDAGMIEGALEADLLGTERYFPRPATGSDWPGRYWVPTALSSTPAELAVDWSNMAGMRLTRPFFEASARRARNRVLNRLIRPRTPLSLLASLAPGDGRRRPDGLIFHMSRCGSTLVAQMLAADPANIVVSEPAPLDAIVTLCQTRGDVPIAERLRLLRAMAGALGRDRHGDAQHYVIKLDSWHTRALPLFRAAFPDTPWVYLYRDPVEVMMSHIALYGMQVVAGALPGVYDLPGAAGMAPNEYCARILARIGEAVLEHWSLGGGLLINYSALPGAVSASILPHFGIAPDDTARSAMIAASRRDAKAPDEVFASDVAHKQSKASAEIRAAAGLIDASYAGLEALRAKSGAR